MTKTDTLVGTATWLVGGIICLTGIPFLCIPCLGCQFIPCCISDLKDVEHTCPNCNTFLGKHRVL